MEDTYLDPEAMANRIGRLQNQSEVIFKEISKTIDVMNRLRKYFEGSSANRLQKKFDDLSNTYSSLKDYLLEKATMMQELTQNIQASDEE